MERKRGQASMEFLMTYGWAILAAVLAIGALAYFGVFSPGRSLPNICTVNAPLGCDEFQVSTTDVRIILRNGAGDSITISNFSVSGCGENVVSTVIADGGVNDYVISCNNTLGSKFNGNIEVSYLRSGKTITEKVTGDIRAEVQ